MPMFFGDLDDFDPFCVLEVEAQNWDGYSGTIPVGPKVWNWDDFCGT
jgi:hypothetical protein